MFRRWISSGSGSRLSGEQWLAQLKPDRRMLKWFEVSYAHSSGKGGQHVNTTDSKAQIRLTRQGWFQSRDRWINGEVFDQIMQNYSDKAAPERKRFPYFTSAGDVLIVSQESRKREANLERCLEKFVGAVKDCGVGRPEVSSETKSEWGKRAKRDNERRLDGKKRRSDKKQLRRKVTAEYD